MKLDAFDVFWSKAILPCSENAFEDLSEDDIKTYQINLDTNVSFKNRLFQVYNQYRDILHKYYFNGGSDALIDRHKISSCIIGALIECRPISYLMIPSMPIEVFLSNYKIAFFSGVKSLYLLRIAQWVNDGNMEDYADTLCKQGMFKFPKTQQGHDEYSLGRIKALALTNSYNQPFDILAYADMLYWIERFNEENIFRLLDQSDK